MSTRRDIRLQLFGTPIPDFSGEEFPSECDVFRVFMWYEDNSQETSPLEKVTNRLRDYCQTLGKTPQPKKNVIEKVKAVVKKGQKFDKRSDLLDSPNLTGKKAMFRRIVDIEQKDKESKVKRVKNKNH